MNHDANHSAFDPAQMARRLVRFADDECRDEPLYDALCRIGAASPDILALMQAAAPEQRRANLLLAAVHDLVLAGSGHALAAYFPSVGGVTAVDAALPAHLRDFSTQHRGLLRERIATRSTQTNEIGRCAVLWPVLQHLAASTGRTRLALLDLGCSAGLNLGVDAYAFDYGSLRLGAAAAAGVPQVRCTLRGTLHPPGDAPVPTLVERLGIDPAPVDVNDEAAVRWLRACLWPHDAPRRQRLDAAVALARRRRWPVRREADCALAAQAWAESLAPAVLPVVFNSWVLTYFAPDALARHRTLMTELVQRRGVAWISAEEPRLRSGDELPPPLPPQADHELRAGTLWALMQPGAKRPHCRVVARSHPHGKWLEWWAAAAQRSAT